jgi:predicted ArsR family transcriptional regulator
MSRLAETMAPGAYYPDAPGFKERGGTSQEAARRASGTSKRLQDEVLAALRLEPATADQVAARLGKGVLGIRPRLSELREQGKIEPTGERRRNDSGASAAVWRVRPDVVE